MIATPAEPGAAPALWRGEHRAVTIGIVSLITLMAFEGIGTATAMPVIARELDALGAYTWAFSGFVMASLLSMVAGGLWCDAAGPRRPLVAGVTSFVTGALVAGFAPTLPVLVAGRLLQGLGAGVVIVATYVLIARAYPEDLRPKAFSVLSAAWVIPALAGPLIAGWLSDSVTWRAVFWLVPLFVIPPVLLLFPRLGAFDGGVPQPHARTRLVAGVIAAVGLLAGQDGVLRLSVVGGLEALAGLGLVAVSARLLLPAGALIMRRGLASSVMMRGFLAGSFFGAEVFVPLALIEIRGISTTAAGLILAVSAAFWSVGSFAQSRLPGGLDRAAAVRLGAGIVTLAVATLPIAILTPLPPWVAGISWAIGALGMGLAFPSIAVQVMRLSPVEDQGRNSAAIQVTDSVFVVLVLCVLGFGHALAVASGGATVATYVLLWLAAAAIAGTGALLAGRMSPSRWA
ncbi:MAG: MFS transporter [Candidatus Nanopelagicales bacterium]